MTWNIDLFLNGSPPTMSMCTLARNLCLISGWVARNAIVPSTSGPQIKRKVRLGRGNSPASTRCATRRRRLQDRDTSASIVVCARPLVVQMAAVHDFTVGRVRARNRASHDSPLSWTDARLDMGIQDHRLASSPTFPQSLGRLAGHHEGEYGRLPRIQMAPANQRWIRARPGGCLVGHVADDAHRTMLRDCQLLHSRQNAIRQDNLAAHILAGVVALTGSVTHIDKPGLHVGTVTVVGETDGVGFPISEQQMLRTNFPQPCLFNRPAQVRAHQPIVPGAIDRELLAMNVGEAVLARPLISTMGRATT